MGLEILYFSALGERIACPCSPRPSSAVSGERNSLSCSQPFPFERPLGFPPARSGRELISCLSQCYFADLHSALATIALLLVADVLICLGLICSSWICAACMDASRMRAPLDPFRCRNLRFSPCFLATKRTRQMNHRFRATKMESTPEPAFQYVADYVYYEGD